MFDVHASSGLYAMRAAVEHKGASLVLAVTVLTSMDDLEVARVFGCQAENAVKRLAKLAADAKCDGIVCSPRDLEALKDDDRFAGLLKVTPGVRPTWAQNNDQQRVMTPGEAIEAGADYLVIGRPITKPSAHEGRIPSLAARMIAEEIQAALAKRGRR
jgi:orotidine-5'-phosphate decarboxylase